MYKSSGFPTRVSDYIELPSIGELMTMPFMKCVSLEKALIWGTEFQKSFLAKVPFTYTKNYISVSFSVQYLTPTSSPVMNIFKLDKEWHIDAHGSFEEEDTIYHILMNECYSKTEFNTHSFITNAESPTALNKMLNAEHHPIHKLLSPQEVEANRIITFTNNDIHRAKRPPKPEFRFFFRAIEENVKRSEEGEIGLSMIYRDGRDSYISLEQELRDGKVDKVIINYY